MSDVISRQAAIDYFVINVGFHDEDGYPIEDTDELRKIWTEYFDGIPPAPPAQPERTPMQELLDVTADRDYWEAQCHSYEMTIDRLTKSAQPERIRGHWEVASTGYSGFMRCSACKTGCCGDYRSMNFCPNCGADMREVTDGNHN